ncbi:MAG: PH domain-containing protein [Planctomycetaceae bacterium]|jgi:uncharacterized membrane protein YdbT with pleckstrin-like domain|nr:PH domain-containing protein [Planctomycetaceae bacterium]
MEKELDIDREKVIEYLTIFLIIECVICCLTVIGILVVVAYYYWISKWVSPTLYANTLKYGLDDKTLRVEQGIIIRRSMAIPLDQITDIKLTQDLLMRYVGIWKLVIQTAGSSFPEAILVGLVNPKQIRDEILDARNTYIKSLKSA